MLKTTTILAGAAAMLTLIAAPAEAHPKLLSSTPAANATVARSNRVELRFNERLVAKFSGANIVMTGARGRPPEKLAGVTSRVGADGKTLIVTTKAPLRAGGYRLDWYAVAADTHRIKGSFAFAVK